VHENIFFTAQHDLNVAVEQFKIVKPLAYVDYGRLPALFRIALKCKTDVGYQIGNKTSFCKKIKVFSYLSLFTRVEKISIVTRTISH